MYKIMGNENKIPLYSNHNSDNYISQNIKNNFISNMYKTLVHY